MDISTDINSFLDDLINNFYSSEKFTYHSTAPFTNVCFYLIFKRNNFKNVFYYYEDEDNVKYLNSVIIYHKSFEPLDYFIDHILNSDSKTCFSSIIYIDSVIRHEFLVVYDRDSNTLQFLDPNHESIFGSYNPYGEICEYMSSRINGLKYIKTEDLYGTDFSQEEKMKLDFNTLSCYLSKSSGYCASWTILFADLITYYQNITPLDIIQILYERNKDKTLIETKRDLSKIIVSYILSIYEEMKDEYSKNGISLDLESFEDYQEQYVYSDKKMYDIICGYFDN